MQYWFTNRFVYTTLTPGLRKDPFCIKKISRNSIGHKSLKSFHLSYEDNDRSVFPRRIKYKETYEGSGVAGA